MDFLYYHEISLGCFGSASCTLVSRHNNMARNPAEDNILHIEKASGWFKGHESTEIIMLNYKYISKSPGNGLMALN